jgi:hypothetical protein
MNIKAVRNVLLRCAVINYAILIVWFVALITAHDWIHQIHSRWFKLSPEQFDFLQYQAIAIYKMGVLLFNVVPFLALKVAIKRSSPE